MKIDEFLDNVEARKAIKESMVSNPGSLCPTSTLTCLPVTHSTHMACGLQATYTSLYVPKRPRSGSHPDLSNLANSNSQQKGTMSRSSSQQSLGKSPSQQSLSKSSSQQNLASPDKADAGHNKIPKSPNPKQQNIEPTA